MVWYIKPLWDGVNPSADLKPVEGGATESGFYMKDDVILLQAEVVNYKPELQKVYVTIDYEFLPEGKVGVDSLSELISVGITIPLRGWGLVD
jgi:hypothetical protein